MDSEGFSAILQLIVELCQEELMADSLFTYERKWCDCSVPTYVLNGSYPRSFKTSLSKFSFPCRRLLFRNCKSMITPIMKFLSFEKHQIKSNELEKLVIDTVSKDSYRRPVATLDEQGFVKVAQTSAHHHRAPREFAR